MTQEKSDHPDDRRLGMDQPISRRDFLQGVALATLTASGPVGAAASPSSSVYYPPLLTGLRGNHPGSFEAAHALRDGQAWPDPIDSGEAYDLIVVGGGISGLAAAHFYQARHARRARVLILDNHDDFGGHAKRNEFHLSGELHLMNGGTLEIDSPRPYSPVAAGLLSTLGIDVAKLGKTAQQLKYYEQRGLRDGLFFDRETFGADVLASGMGHVPYAQLLAAAPLSAQARADIVQIQEAHIDYLPGLTSDEKKDRLSRISYVAFLRDLVHAQPEVIRFYLASTLSEWGVGADAISALDCWAYGLAGFQGMNLAKGSIDRMGYTPAGYHDTGGSLHLHFPDGNASIARALVRDLIPDAIPGTGIENLVTARANYARLDDEQNNTRIRLNSIVIATRHRGAPDSAEGVEVTYLRDGRPFKVRGKAAVLACYNAVIPSLCPELPDAQKQALHQAVKAPLVYVSVALRNWQAFEALKISSVYAPGAYFVSLRLNSHVTIGRYRSSSSPSRPIMVRMTRVPSRPGLPELDQNRAGRAELLATPFKTYERNIRDQLNRCLHGGGFDAARDIMAITVNRWPHGYAHEYNPLFDPEIPVAQRANVIGRQRHGRIVIANSDAGAAAYTDSAIDQAYRAVAELPGE